MKYIYNDKLSLATDIDKGVITALKFSSDRHGMNYLISEETLKKYEFSDSDTCLLGKSRITYSDIEIDTGTMKPSSVVAESHRVLFEYHLDKLVLSHEFSIQDDKMTWNISVENSSSSPLKIDKMLHWMPVGYVMHKNAEENLNHSCAMVPSICGSRPYLICKKRSGEGPNLVVLNQTGEMKSVGSLCNFTNLFFEESSPSLNGLLLFNTVNAYQNGQMLESPVTDWQYKEMYRTIELAPGEKFYDSYLFAVCKDGGEAGLINELGGVTVDFPPVTFCGKYASFQVNAELRIMGCKCFMADEAGVREEELEIELNGTEARLGPFGKPGERKVVFTLENGLSCFVVMAVYTSTRDIVEAVCDYIYTDRFVSDPESPDYCAYRSVSPQGESCSKGSLLLLKSLLTKPDVNQIRQVERNTVYYLKPNWLDDDFIPLKKYPGGFARMADFAYLALQFYFLSLFDDNMLEINSSDTYLMWAYKVALYRLTVTVDKKQRELDEMGGPFMAMLDSGELSNELIRRGYQEEGVRLKKLMDDNLKIQTKNDDGKSYFITEHYFDNAGLAVFTEYFLSNHITAIGMKAAKYLLPNVSYSTDYRNFAPDRWWEALAPMYHNLWAVYPAKAMLLAYETSRNTDYLFAAYRAMMPMFYNYDWNAVSALRKLKKGEGVSTYCLTSPNLNMEYASHNRFGQSAFTGEFFDKLNLAGDDWDMGLDMIMYLQTFGQKTYVVLQDGNPVAVNGSLEGTMDHMRIESFAAYPGQYYFESLGMTISRASMGFVITAVVMHEGKCVCVEVRRLTQECTIDVDCVWSDRKERISPQIVIV